MTALLLSLALIMSSVPEDSVHSRRTTVDVDTLREVEVRPDSSLQVTKAIAESLMKNKQPHSPSLGEILDKAAPHLQDKILHPFAFQDRKRERKHRRDAKLIKEFDRTNTPNGLLEEALRREGLGHIIDERKEKEKK